MTCRVSMNSYPWRLSVSFLKEFRVVLHTADGSSCHIPMSPNAKKIQLLAYLAWQRDQNISRKKIIDIVIRHGVPKGDAAPEKLANKFHQHVKLVKRDIRAAVIQLNTQRGADPLPTNLNLFEYRKQGWWRLSPIWEMTDLERIETYAHIVREAEHRLFSGPLPEHMRKACDALIESYPGDFLEEMLRTYPEEFRPVAKSWVREPYTLYRDYYLQALWCAAEDEWQRGKVHKDKSWGHFEQGAELFRKYGMYACNSRLDSEVSFQTEKHRAGIRVFMSEEAICRSLATYKAQGRMQEFEICRQAYTQQMEQVSHGVWKPGNKLRDIM